MSHGGKMKEAGYDIGTPNTGLLIQAASLVYQAVHRLILRWFWLQWT